MMGKVIKRLLAVQALFFALVLPFGGVALAADPFDQACNTPGAQDSTLCREKSGHTTQTTASNSIYGPNGILNRAARLIAAVVGVAAVIMIMIGGFKYIISSGDSNNIQSAKNTILYALIGLFIAAFTQAIVVFVLNRL